MEQEWELEREWKMDQEQKQNTMTDKELIESLGVQQYKKTYFAAVYSESFNSSHEFDSVKKAMEWCESTARKVLNTKSAIIERTVIHTVRHA